MEQPRQQRSMMKPASEPARRWAEALRVEVEQWPGVSIKPAFGMMLIYRNGVVFGALPMTRSLYEEDAILLKFVAETPALAKRIRRSGRFAGMIERGENKSNKMGEGRKWRIYLLREDRDAREAVEWLALAYQVAGESQARGKR